MPEEFLQRSTEGVPAYTLKKIFASGQKLPAHLQTIYPASEIVDDVNSIAQDENIELIIVSASHLQYAKEALATGKPVRILG
jgi:predicted dehydrogenase